MLVTSDQSTPGNVGGGGGWRHRAAGGAGALRGGGGQPSHQDPRPQASDRPQLELRLQINTSSQVSRVDSCLMFVVNKIYQYQDNFG